MFETRCPLGCLTTICFERCWRASSRRAARWRMTETRLSLSSPSAPQTCQVLSASPSSGTNKNKSQVKIDKVQGNISRMQNRRRKDFSQDHWSGGVCFQLSINSGAKLQQPGDFSCWDQVWLGGWLCEFEVLIFLTSGDDDIGPRHDLHHVPNYHHQIIDQIGNQYSSVMRNAFFKIIFSRSWERYFCNQTNKIILFSQNLHCFGIHRVETDKRHPQIHSLSWSPSRSGCTQNSFLVELLSIAPIPKLRSHPDARLIWNKYSFLQADWNSAISSVVWVGRSPQQSANEK